MIRKSITVHSFDVPTYILCIIKSSVKIIIIIRNVPRNAYCAKYYVIMEVEKNVYNNIRRIYYYKFINIQV